NLRRRRRGEKLFSPGPTPPNDSFRRVHGVWKDHSAEDDQPDSRSHERRHHDRRRRHRRPGTGHAAPPDRIRDAEFWPPAPPDDRREPRHRADRAGNDEEGGPGGGSATAGDGGPRPLDRAAVSRAALRRPAT